MAETAKLVDRVARRWDRLLYQRSRLVAGLPRTVQANYHAGTVHVPHQQTLIAPPFTAIAVQRSYPAAHSRAVAEALQSLAAEGMQPLHLALLLETFAKLRADRQRSDDAVELVWTGPELPGTVNRDTAVVVRELFSGARAHVLVVGYVVYQGHEVFRALASRMDQNPDLRVRMVLGVKRDHGDTSATSQILHRFAHRFRTQEWPGTRLPEVFYDPRSLEIDSAKRSSLHAKCIVVDCRVAFVSSANFTQAAQVRNIEVGTLIHSEHFADQLVEHFEGLAASNLLLALPGLGLRRNRKYAR